MSSSLAKPLTRPLDGDDLPLHCRTRSVTVHLQLLSEMGKRQELLGASGADVRGELVGRVELVVRHRSGPVSRQEDPPP